MGLGERGGGGGGGGRRGGEGGGREVPGGAGQPVQLRIFPLGGVQGHIGTNETASEDLVMSSSYKNIQPIYYAVYFFELNLTQIYERIAQIYLHMLGQKRGYRGIEGVA